MPAVSTTAAERDATAQQPAGEVRPPFSFVVPCFNEEHNLAGTVAEIHKAAHSVGLEGYEIVVVDDGSRDGTGAEIARLPTPNCRRDIRPARFLNTVSGGSSRRGKSPNATAGYS